MSSGSGGPPNEELQLTKPGLATIEPVFAAELRGGLKGTTQHLGNDPSGRPRWSGNGRGTRDV